MENIFNYVSDNFKNFHFLAGENKIKFKNDYNNNGFINKII